MATLSLEEALESAALSLLKKIEEIVGSNSPDITLVGSLSRAACDLSEAALSQRVNPTEE